MSPTLVYRYRKGFERPLTPEERFKLLDAPCYKQDAAGNPQTITSTGRLCSLMNIPLKESLLDSAKQDSTKAHTYRILKALQELKDIKAEKIESLLQDLQKSTQLSTHPFKCSQRI